MPQIHSKILHIRLRVLYEALLKKTKWFSIRTMDCSDNSFVVKRLIVERRELNSKLTFLQLVLRRPLTEERYKFWLLMSDNDYNATLKRQLEVCLLTMGKNSHQHKSKEHGWDEEHPKSMVKAVTYLISHVYDMYIGVIRNWNSISIVIWVQY